MNNRIDPRRCKEFLYDTYPSRQCLSKPKSDGYCLVHHPERIKAKRDARNARWKKESIEREAKWKSEEAMENAQDAVIVAARQFIHVADETQIYDSAALRDAVRHLESLEQE